MNFVKKYYDKCNTDMLDDYLPTYLKDNQIVLYKTWIDELSLLNPNLDKKSLVKQGIIDVNMLVQGYEYVSAVILYNDPHQIIFKISQFGSQQSMPSEMILTILENSINFGFDQSVEDPRHFAEYEPEIQEISEYLFHKNFSELNSEEINIIVNEWIYPIISISDFDFVPMDHDQQIDWLESKYQPNIPVYFKETQRVLTFKRNFAEDQILQNIIRRFKNLFQTYLIEL